MIFNCSGGTMKCLVLVLLAFFCFASPRAQTLDRYRTVALTFDDLPDALDDLAGMRRNTPELLRTLKLHNAPAIGFVNESKLHAPGELDARTAVLKQWVNAG